MISRKWIMVAIIFVLLFLGASCAKPSPTATPTPSPTATPMAKPLVFGISTALRHPTGQGVLHFAKFAAMEINDKGGVLVGGVRRPIKIVALDSREDEPGVPLHEALMTTEKLILEHKPAGIVGLNWRSECVLGAMDLVAKYKIISFSPVSVSPAVPKKFAEDPQKYKYFFKTNINSIEIAKVHLGIYDHLKKKYGMDKVYFIVQDVLWARKATEVLKEKLEKMGWKVVGYDVYPTGATDFSSSLAKAKDGGVQFIHAHGEMSGFAGLTRQMKAIGVKAALGLDIPILTSLGAWDTFGKDLEGVILTSYMPGYFPVKAIPESVRLHEDFVARMGRETLAKCDSTNGHVSAYVAVHVLAKAIEKADTLDADALIPVIEETDMMTPGGRLRFDENHAVIYSFDPKEGFVPVIFQWVGGKQVPVYPETIAEAEIRLPKGL